MVLVATNRANLDEDAALLAGLVRRMIRADYPNRLPATMAVFRAAYRVLDSPANPTPLDSDYRVYSHVKNLGRTASALADVFDPRPAARFVARPGLPPEQHTS
ncbi:hypothetical protein [Streptomyces sp. NPDC046821]|uniref:hypothetical protein n=1 Tax=Streptomyces sp. NPDC046821 TaxID=3154702 RepID=UPI00340D56E0